MENNNIEKKKLSFAVAPKSFDYLPGLLSAESVELHYTGHHLTYNKNIVNYLEENPRLKETLLGDQDLLSPTKSQEESHWQLRSIIKYAWESNNVFMYDNSAQIWNHNLLWKSFKKNEIREENLESFVQFNYPKTYSHICRDFTSFVHFIQEIVNAHQKCFGNIWIWIAFDVVRKEVQIKVSPNAWTLAICDSLVPMLVIDLWEHSYYLEYKNKKMDFIHKAVHYLNWQLLEAKLQELNP